MDKILKIDSTILMKMLSVLFFALTGCVGSMNSPAGNPKPFKAVDVHLLQGTWLQTQLIQKDQMSGRDLVIEADSTGKVDGGDAIDAALSYRFSAFKISGNTLVYMSGSEDTHPVEIIESQVRDTKTGSTLLQIE